MTDSDHTLEKPNRFSHFVQCIICIASFIVYIVADHKVIDEYSLQNEYNIIVCTFWVTLSLLLLYWIIFAILIYDPERTDCSIGLLILARFTACVVIIYYYGVLWDNNLKEYMPVYKDCYTTLRSSVIPPEFKDMWVYAMMCVVVKIELGLFILGLSMIGLGICGIGTGFCCSLCCTKKPQVPQQFSDPLDIT